MPLLCHVRMPFTDLAWNLWDDLVMADDEMNEHQNGGALAVISNTLGELKSQLGANTKEVTTIREYMIRFDEKQRGWATKHEVGEITIGLRSDMSKVEAKAERALTRTDELSGTLGVLGGALEGLRTDISSLRTEVSTRSAEVRGATSILRPTLAWVAAIAAAIVAAVVGHYIG